jgi:hypothetical protein
MSEKQTTFSTVNCAEKFESPNQWISCYLKTAGKLPFTDEAAAEIFEWQVAG